jgi:hypothetical protein
MRFIIAAVVFFASMLFANPAKAADPVWEEIIPSNNLPTRYYEFPGYFLGPVSSQQYGSCVANSAGGAMGWLSRYQFAQDVDFDYLGVYFGSENNSMVATGQYLQTTGAKAINGPWAGQHYVVKQNKLYDHSKYPGKMWKSAPPTRALVKHSIAVQHRPVQIGFLGFDSFKQFYQDSWTPYKPYPGEPNGNYRHAVLVYGYDELGIYIRNSWGTNWGNGGNMRMSWEFFDQHVNEAMQYYGLRRK